MSAFRVTNCLLLRWRTTQLRKLAQIRMKTSHGMVRSIHCQMSSYNFLSRPFTTTRMRFLSSISEQRPEQRPETGQSSQTKKEGRNPQTDPNKIKVIFICADGRRLEGYGKEGDNLLDVVVNDEIDIDGFGACEGTLSCSTCHLIFSQEDYDKLDSKPTDEELDMLDLAYELTDTSRLGCQVTLRKDMDGIEVRVPATVNDARAS